MNHKALHFGNIARSSSESVRPDLWMDYMWCPMLGNQGSVLLDHSGRFLNGTITGAIYNNNGLYFDGTNAKVVFGQSLSMAYSERTIFVRFYLLDVTSDHVLLTKSNDTFNTDGMWSLLFDNAVGVHSGYSYRICFAVRKGTTTTDWPWIHGSVISANEWYTVAVIHKNGVSLEMYLNGIPDTIWAQAATTAMTTVSATSLQMGTNTDDGKDMNGYISHCFTVDKALTQAQIMDLHADPFLPLRRKTMVSFYVPSAGGTTFKPAWARHCNKLIGAY